MSISQPKKLFSLKALIPPTIIMLCVLIVYAIAGIFPFGSESVVYNDMGQCSLPTFYALWDALHGNGSILFNLKTAGGVFITGEFENALVPFNILFFLICPRAKILEGMSFFLLLKLMISSFTACLYFRYKFRLSDLYLTIFSVLYALNPFLLQYYTNISWVEVVMVFPLIMLGLEMLFREEKVLLYIVSLAYSLIIQLYISYMIMLFLFLSGGLYIGLTVEKELRKKAVLRFGVSSILALFLSAFSALPSFFHMSESSRFQNTRSFIQILTANTSNPLVQKGGMAVIMTALPTAIVLGLLFLIKKEKKIVLYHSVLILFFLIPIAFENVNLIWHMGSYVNFPMRFAFIYQLVLLSAAATVLDNLPQEWHRNNVAIQTLSVLFSIVGGIFSLFLLIHSYSENATAMVNKNNIKPYVIGFVILVIAYFFLLHFGFKKFAAVMISIFVLGESCIYFFASVTSGPNRSFEYTLDYIEECDIIHENLNIPNDSISRIKNIDGTLNNNYPLILNYASMSNFTHIIPSTIKKSMSRLGYSNIYTRILDTGGTLFSDALLGYKYSFSLSPLPNTNYKYISTAGRYMVYENLFSLPFGVVCEGDLDTYRYNEPGRFRFSENNDLWKFISGSDLDLFTEPDKTITKNEHSMDCSFYVDGQKELYLYTKINNKRRNMQIYVNGDLVPVPSMGEPANTKFNTRFNNGVLDLGEFSDMPVRIHIDLLSDSLKIKDLQFEVSLMDKALLSSYCESQNTTQTLSVSSQKISVSVSGKEGQYLFLPLSYEDGWSCRVNGSPVEIDTILDNFILVPLSQGANDITLHYMPKGFVPGLLISIFSAVCAIGWYIFNKKYLPKIKNEKLLNILLGAYYAVSYGAIGAIYILPIIGTFYTWITNK